LFRWHLAGDVLPPCLPRTMPWRASGRRVESAGFAQETG
jgi:hypothetical protein